MRKSSLTALPIILVLAAAPALSLAQAPDTAAIAADTAAAAVPAGPAVEPPPAPATAPAEATSPPPAPRPVTRTVAEAPGAVLDQGRSLWADVLQPTAQRLVGAVPTLARALLFLLLFWIAANVLGALVRKGLSMTRLDDRAATELGLARVLKGPDGKTRSLEAIVGTTVKWIVLLFGLVAFFQALDLGMVAAPLQSVVDKIVSITPRLLQAALILVAYWVIATIVRFVLARGLGAVNFDGWSSRLMRREPPAEGAEGASAVVGRLAFYVILAFGLPPFLDALGQRALVAPLAGMLEKIFGFIPNVIAAVVILFLGRLVAAVIREIVVNFLAAVGADRGAERLGLAKAVGSARLSEIGGAVAYFFVFLPVLATAVESLQIRALSEPIAATLERLFAALPLVIVALLVVGVGLVLARMIRELVENLLRGVGFDALPEKLGLSFLRGREGGLGPSAIGGLVVFVVILVLTVQQALATLQLTQLSDLVGRLVAFLPSLVFGLALVLAAIALAGAVGRIVESTVGKTGSGRWLASAARITILFVGVSMGLTELGVGEDVVRIAVSAALGGTALALGLAFGLGGRDRAREFLDSMRR